MRKRRGSRIHDVLLVPGKNPDFILSVGASAGNRLPVWTRGRLSFSLSAEAKGHFPPEAFHIRNKKTSEDDHDLLLMKLISKRCDMFLSDQHNQNLSDEM